jgi:hypothetical protein
VEQADAQQVVAGLAAKAITVLGDSTRRCGEEDDDEDDEDDEDDGEEEEINPQGLNNSLRAPMDVAFVPAHPDWLLTTECRGGCIKLNNIRTGEMICTFGKHGRGEGQFMVAWGVACTSDGSFVLVADAQSHRVQMLRLVVNADGSSAHLEFVRFIGSKGTGEGKLDTPSGVALLPSTGERQEETVLVTEQGNKRISQFSLDGAFVSVFAGGCKAGSSGDELALMECPIALTVLPLSGEVAVADNEKHRVQVFDSSGCFKRQFGTHGSQVDGQLHSPSGLASDAHDNLLVTDSTNRVQVFSAKGGHLCTRKDLGLHRDFMKGAALGTDGGLAIANSAANQVLLWPR